MTRLSTDKFDTDGRLIDGFDYANQAWVADGFYLNCGHILKDCGCYGREHQGRRTTAPKERTYECQVQKVERQILWVDVQAGSAEEAAKKATIQAEDGELIIFESDTTTAYETIKATEGRYQR
jgi:hypothetical protein